MTGFAVLILSYLVNAMDRQVFFPLLPSIRSEYGFSLTEGGSLATSFTLGMAVAGLPAGYLLDRFSRKTVLVVSIMIYSLGTMATALAGGFAEMAAYRVVSGVGEGMQSAALFAVIGTYFFHRRGLAFGGTAVAFGTGVILGPLVGVHLATLFQSWRAPFVLFGATGAALAVIALFVVSRRLTERAESHEATIATHDHMPASPYNRNSIALAASSAVSGLVVYGFLGLYPTFLISHLHYTTAQAALAASFVGYGGMLALVAGWLGDRVNQRTLLMVTYLGVSATSLLVYQTQATIGWQCLFASLMGFFAVGSLYTNHNSAMQRAVRPEHVGRASGLFISSYYTSSAFSGLLFAALVNHLGWRQAGMWQVTLLPLLAILALTFVHAPHFIAAPRRRTD
ncbi:MFS transporter [Streptomyces fulvoviolaceus]|uniref:MFS transporter n=1 Tax=Streptomyces fulvoviolaceus TaxID=285535 RepID=UPI000ABE242A|nr:MFS transporter [Streptomyces fulvoviolaceus]